MSMDIDPLWIQAIFTIILVIITAIYAKFTHDVVEESKKTRETIWELEEKKFIQNKNRLRKVIVEELHTNCMFYDEIVDIVKGYREKAIPYSKGPWETSMSDMFEDDIMSRDLRFPITSTYDNLTIKLGDLGKEELSAISYVYRDFIEIGLDYAAVRNTLANKDVSFKEFLKLTTFVEHFEVGFIPKFCIKLEIWYKKLFEGEINEEELEKKIKNFFKKVGL